MTVSKAGAEVKVTVGKPEVIINGESRPLDVPPMMYQGIVLVPVRVISEGMGAYVQWVPDRRLVVVRYIPATPPPCRLRHRRRRHRRRPRRRRRRLDPFYDVYVAGDYIISPQGLQRVQPRHERQQQQRRILVPHPRCDRDPADEPTVHGRSRLPSIELAA